MYVGIPYMKEKKKNLFCLPLQCMIRIQYPVNPRRTLSSRCLIADLGWQWRKGKIVPAFENPYWYEVERATRPRVNLRPRS